MHPTDPNTTTARILAGVRVRRRAPLDRSSEGRFAGRMTMAQQTVQWRFERGDAGADEIQSSVDEILSQLADPTSEVSGAARAAGLDLAGLGDAAVEGREGRQGAEPMLTTIG